MQVMTDHKWFDNDIDQRKTIMRVRNNVIEIEFTHNADVEALLLHRDDVIAMAKEFGLVLFEKQTQL